MLARVLRDQSLIFGTASLFVAFGGAYAMFEWAMTEPVQALVGQAGIHDRNPEAACLDCHVPFRGTPATRCLAPGCHGSLATGTPPRNGPAMPIRFHAALRGHDCGMCHTEHGSQARSPRDRMKSPPATPPTAFSHERLPFAVRTRCHICHPGQDVPNHARTDAVSCDLCHDSERWTGASMAHARVHEHACDLCHRAPGDARHASVAGNCQDCHGTERFLTDQPAEK